jgi:hypothetical protein
MFPEGVAKYVEGKQNLSCQWKHMQVYHYKSNTNHKQTMHFTEVYSPQ